MRLILAVLALVGCSSPTEREVPRYSPSPLPTPWVEPRPTDAQKAEAQRASFELVQSLIATITEIDDGVTSPEIIARAALEQNRKLMTESVRTKTAHIAGAGEMESRAVEENLRRLPTDSQVQMAILLVLKIRKGDLPPEDPTTPPVTS